MSADYIAFTEAVYKKTGIDLTLYKESQMKRRLTSLRDKRGFISFSDYYKALRSDEQLFKEFLERMTINVSEFFRNRSRWDILETRILPELVKQRGSLKMWSAACSTGEEPYSLSILLHLLELKGSILATDLDESILNRARAGLYMEKSLKEVPPAQRDQFFTKDLAGWKISERIKKPVTFKKHNLLQDTYPAGLDLIVCRNVMIYFTEEAKIDIYNRFSDSLRTGGILFVGSTEQIFNPAKFGLESADTFFYRKS
ncbi:CheR family methyltransferase [Bacillus daqingensis]|uniref:protein-glutamate O-methyltransferase n=1 Tax=Bacillus daqingensis TaxID=872396 RepID=A0ABV9NT77_9BACI